RMENGTALGLCTGYKVSLLDAHERCFHHVLLLNSDTKVLPNLLSELVSVMDSDPSIAIAGAKNLLMENPKYTWGKYGRVTWGPMLVRTEGRFAIDWQLQEPPKDVDWVIANGCMIRREA